MNSIINSVRRYLTDGDYRFRFNAGKGLLKNMPDEEYLKRMFHAKFGYDLDLDHPDTFNAKLQWLKLYDRNPEYTVMVDKAGVKEYVSERTGKQYIIPTLGIWNRVEDIDLDSLPDQFVLKCTHDSHGLVICKDKHSLNWKTEKKKLKAALKKEYFYSFREWPYKNVKPRIIAEKYLSDEHEGLTDYKIHCFNGIPKVILVCEGRYSSEGITEDFYDINWNHLDLKRPDIPFAKTAIAKPAQLEEMLTLAEKLSAGIPFVRIDLYIVDGSVFFGEITFFPASGFKKFEPESYDLKLGKYLDLSEIQGKNTTNAFRRIL